MTTTAVALPEHEAVTSAVRDARAGDNDALVALAAACPMAGDLVMCVDRGPDFFALTRLEGERFRVGVTEKAGAVTGCITASARTAYVNGRAMQTAYVGDLKVVPRHRGGPSADLLTEFARAACREYGGGSIPTLSTVLAGNRSVERRVTGPRGLPRLTPFASLNVHAIPFLFARRAEVSGLLVTQARIGDVEEMAALWARVAPARQFAPMMDAESLLSWMRATPGLAPHDYLVARRVDGRIAGFVGVWNQRSFKQLRVIRYSARIAVARVAVNAMARFAGTNALPEPGGALASLGTVHLCAPPDEPAVLRALLLRAYAMHRGSESLLLTVTLDTRDPLNAALAGFFAQPTLVRAYITTPSGIYAGPALSDRPLHFESALV